MTAVVFLGPTLRTTEVAEHLDAQVLPPVQQGDVYRVVRDKPRAIGIIDGYFDGVPSVWHKEILWAMQQGIPVYGSASMGALRASELADFGMIGVGGIYDAYRDGRIQDDDEVAVLHSPAELGFQPLSEPMVSIRATLEDARTSRILDPDQAETALNVAKALNYRDRGWEAIIAAVGTQIDADAFSGWLKDGRVDAKGDDARQMLARMAQDLSDGTQVRSGVRVEPTLAWRELCTRVDQEQATTAETDPGILDELRLVPTHYARLRDRAALSVLAGEEARRQGAEPDRQALLDQMSRHRMRTGLTRQADLLEWLAENDMTPDHYEGMLGDMVRADTAVLALSDRLNAALMSEIRRDGQYAAFKERADRKAHLMPDQPATSPSAGRIQTLIWYFETRLDQPVPDDLESHAIALGLEGRKALLDLIETEYLFCQLNGGPDTTDPSA